MTATMITTPGLADVTAAVWRPGQATGLHDHITRCVVGVLQGVEHEEPHPIGFNDDHPGDVNGFAPPGDVHRIVDTGTETAISLRVYGTDLGRVDSSVRRHYEPATAER
jgi:predicted metal-dependent enzyme (double-stranded beta helix superfamily)